MVVYQPYDLVLSFSMHISFSFFLFVCLLLLYVIGINVLEIRGTCSFPVSAMKNSVPFPTLHAIIFHIKLSIFFLILII